MMRTLNTLCIAILLLMAGCSDEQINSRSTKSIATDYDDHKTGDKPGKKSADAGDIYQQKFGDKILNLPLVDAALKLDEKKVDNLISAAKLAGDGEFGRFQGVVQSVSVMANKYVALETLVNRSFTEQSKKYEGKKVTLLLCILDDVDCTSYNSYMEEYFKKLFEIADETKLKIDGVTTYIFNLTIPLLGKVAQWPELVGVNYLSLERKQKAARKAIVKARQTSDDGHYEMFEVELTEYLRLADKPASSAYVLYCASKDCAAAYGAPTLAKSLAAEQLTQLDQGKLMLTLDDWRNVDAFTDEGILLMPSLNVEKTPVLELANGYFTSAPRITSIDRETRLTEELM